VLREDGPAHVTASCFVFDPGFTSVLLHLHRKAGRWLQFGGHLEAADADARGAAARECAEESGLHELLWFSELPVDVHPHELSSAFGACTHHTDVVYAATADPAAPWAVSEESLRVQWWPLDALPTGIAQDLPGRLPTLAQRARAAQAAAQAPPREG